MGQHHDNIQMADTIAGAHLTPTLHLLLPLYMGLHINALAVGLMLLRHLQYLIIRGLVAGMVVITPLHSIHSLVHQWHNQRIEELLIMAHDHHLDTGHIDHRRVTRLPQIAPPAPNRNTMLAWILHEPGQVDQVEDLGPWSKDKLCPRHITTGMRNQFLALTIALLVITQMGHYHAHKLSNATLLTKMKM
jgi:hypothetical protein